MSAVNAKPSSEQTPHHGLLYRYSAALAGYAPLRLGLALGLLVLVGVTEGIGLLLLAPLLQLVGSDQENTVTGGLLDEATSALDTEHERRIQQAIDKLHGKLTIVLIAHRLSTVRHADLIAVMDAGKVTETGSWESLSQRQAGRFQALLKAATERTEV